MLKLCVKLSKQWEFRRKRAKNWITSPDPQYQLKKSQRERLIKLTQAFLFSFPLHNRFLETALAFSLFYQKSSNNPTRLENPSLVLLPFRVNDYHYLNRARNLPVLHFDVRNLGHNTVIRWVRKVAPRVSGAKHRHTRCS